MSGEVNTSSQVDDAPVNRDSSAFFGRMVVAVVVGVICLAGLVVASLVLTFQPPVDNTSPTPVHVGNHVILVEKTGPPLEVVIISLVGIVIIAGCCVGLEVIGALLSINPRRDRLARLRRRPGGRLPAPGERITTTVVVPAHNEEASLPITLDALSEQTRPPDRVIVVADNCTDSTMEIAVLMGYDAIATVDNSNKKAGALNQALATVLPHMGSTDVILVMDADTSLSERFLEVGAARLEADPELAAVGGIFFGEDGHGLIGQLQRNEYPLTASRFANAKVASSS